MVIRRVVSIITFLAAVGAVSIVAPATAHSGPSVVRYASPSGSIAATCAINDPCHIVQAIDNAPAGATVLIAPGTYTQSGEPLPQELTNTAFPANGGGITIDAQDPTHPPVIYTEATEGVYLIASSVSNIIVISTATTAALDVTGGTVSHVAIYDSAAGVGACAVYNTTMSDSLCVESGANRDAIRTGADDSLTLTGVTAVALGTDGAALGATSNGTNTYTVTATNSIFKGATYDLALATVDTSMLNVTLSHCAYRSFKVLTVGSPSLTGTNTLSTPPKFLGSGSTPYAEAADSASIDKGGPAAAGGTDLAGHPRTLGSHTDIGAYEFLAKPALTKLKLASVSKTAATFSVRVNGEGLASSTQLIAKVGHHSYKSAKTATPAAGSTTVHLKLKGLPKKTTFVARVKAKNQGGTTTSKAKHFTTK